MALGSALGAAVAAGRSFGTSTKNTGFRDGVLPHDRTGPSVSQAVCPGSRYLALERALPAPAINDEEFPNGNGANGLNKTERRLAKLWKEILGVNEADKNDKFFFEFGGHSLLAIQLISSIRKHFQIEISLDELFDFPAIFDMANKIKEKLLAEIEQLSDEEVDQILSKELNSKH